MLSDKKKASLNSKSVDFGWKMLLAKNKTPLFYFVKNTSQKSISGIGTTLNDDFWPFPK